MNRLRKFAIASLSTITILIFGIALTTLPSRSQSPPSTFEQVWQTVNEAFYDSNFNGIDWVAAKEAYEPLAAQTQSKAELAQVINQMLSKLDTSHTHFYTSEDPAYYQLLGIFLTLIPELQPQVEDFLLDGKPQYSGIGIFTEELEGNTFIKAILDDSPAARAGLLVGDQILSVDRQPFHPINSFLDKAGQPVELAVQHSIGNQTDVTVTPQMLDGTTMFSDAMKASVEVIERENKTIGYVHLWSYAGEAIHKQLTAELFYGQLKDVDSFVLDLRDGWGGATASYLNIYTPENLTTTGTARDYPPSTANSAWSKPVVMLVNGDSRSGKEVLAYGFRKYEIGPVVGSRTAGAVVQGNLYPMDDGSLLYLAVADIHVDGKRIEGIGVEPDIAVAAPIKYAQGADPQKEKAVEVALEKINRL